MARWIIGSLLGFLLLIPLLQGTSTESPHEVLAFASNRDGDFDIYLLDLHDDSLTNISDNDVYDSDPVWSRDGRLAFVSVPEEGGNRVPCIWDGATIECLPYAQSDNLEWSADGRLAFVAFGSEDDSDLYIWDGEETINITDSDDLDESSLAWSADGRLAYTSRVQSNDSSLFIWDGENSLALGNSSLETGVPDWYTDGRLVYRDGAHLYVWDGDETTRITDEGAIYNSPTWNAEGRLVFSRSWGANSGDIFIWDGETTTNITNDPDIDHRHPEWSADGRLVFIALFSDGERILYVWDDGTSIPVWDENPSAVDYGWSPGGQLAFTSDADGNTDVYVWDGTSVRNVTNTDGDVFNISMAWQP